MAALTEHAFGEFYRRTARPLWAYVYRVTGSASDADDIVQEAFLRLLKTQLPETAEEAWRRYLFRIAGNLIADRGRRSARDDAWRAGAQQPLAVTRDSQDEDVSRTFAALKVRDRARLWLAYVEEEDHQQIADALGLARGSVKVMLSRARARLRDLLISRGLNTRI